MKISCCFALMSACLIAFAEKGRPIIPGKTGGAPSSAAPKVVTFLNALRAIHDQSAVKIVGYDSVWVNIDGSVHRATGPNSDDVRTRVVATVPPAELERLKALARQATVGPDAAREVAGDYENCKGVVEARHYNVTHPEDDNRKNGLLIIDECGGKLRTQSAQGLELIQVLDGWFTPN